MGILFGYLNKLSIDSKVAQVSTINKVWQEHKLMVLDGNNIHRFWSVPYDIGHNTLIVTLYILRIYLDILETLMNVKNTMGMDPEGVFLCCKSLITFLYKNVILYSLGQ